MSIALDTSRFPIIVTRFPVSWTPDEMDAYFEAMRDVHRRERRFIHVADITESGAMSTSVMRKRATDFMKEERDRSERWCIGSAFVAPSVVLRGIVTALYWANPAPYPHVSVATFDEAMAWSRTRCVEEGISPV